LTNTTSVSTQQTTPTPKSASFMEIVYGSYPKKPVQRSKYAQYYVHTASRSM
jgi:hypothetical protein